MLEASRKILSARQVYAVTSQAEFSVTCKQGRMLELERKRVAIGFIVEIAMLIHTPRLKRSVVSGTSRFWR